MLSFNYKTVAKDVSRDTGIDKDELVKIQFAIFGKVKEALDSTVVEKNIRKNARIKGFGIFVAKEGIIDFFNKANVTKRYNRK